MKKEDERMYEYKAVILNVVDGDTFDLDIDLGFNVHAFERVRLLDIDTPEKKIYKGINEKELGQIVADWVKRTYEGAQVTIKSFKGTDSFGRWLVYINDGKIDFVTLYNELGINKKSESYNPMRIFDLEDNKS